MTNRIRGEVEAVLDGRTWTLCLTLGALAELEAALEAGDLMGLARRFGEGRLAATDAIRIIGAGLRGAGNDVSDADVAKMRAERSALGSRQSAIGNRMKNRLPTAQCRLPSSFEAHMTTAINPEAIVAEAMSWLGTPYRHQASLKGIGCDCLGLLRGVWRAFHGEEPEAMPAYTPDWAEARGVETFAQAAGRHLIAIDIGEAAAGDVLLFRWRANVPAKHAAILVYPSRSDLRSSSPLVGRFIHAQQGAAVSLAALTPWWRRRIAYAFRFPGI